MERVVQGSRVKAALLSILRYVRIACRFKRVRKKRRKVQNYIRVVQIRLREGCKIECNTA